MGQEVHVGRMQRMPRVRHLTTTLAINAPCITIVAIPIATTTAAAAIATTIRAAHASLDAGTADAASSAACSRLSMQYMVLGP